MRDLNFFSVFIEDKKKKNRVASIASFIVVLALGAAAGTWGYYEYKTNSVRDRIAEIDNHKETKKLRDKAKEQRRKLMELTKQQTGLDLLVKSAGEIDNQLSGEHPLTMKNIFMIFNTLPEGVEITTFTIAGDTFNMSCQGSVYNDVTSAAGLLTAQGIDLNLSPVSKTEDEGAVTYQFQIQGVIGGMKNE